MSCFLCIFKNTIVNINYFRGCNFLTFFLLVIPEVVAFGLVDVEVVALDLPILLVATFGPLLPKLITIGKLLVGLVTLDQPEPKLETLGLYPLVELVDFDPPTLGVEVLLGIMFFLGGGLTS